MIRPVISYALTSIILLSQIGLPLHMHYCKGALESVSVLFAAKCSDHDIPVNLPSCCKKELSGHCKKSDDKKCCDDEVRVLKQDITSLSPSFIKWVDADIEIESFTFQKVNPVGISFPVLLEGNTSDSGPPIYILQQALIFYA